MSDNINSSGSNVVAKQAQPGSAAEMTSSALARRRMLLASLGKGSAVVAAAAVPMKSMAGIGTLAVLPDGRRCTISGTMSAVHSHETITATCGGMSPGYYKTLDHWPGYNSTGYGGHPGWPYPTNAPYAKVPFTGGGSAYFYETTRFNTLFGSGSTSKLIDVLNNETNTDEFHWVAALINGSAGNTDAQNFPYNCQQIINFYKLGKGSGGYNDALNFIKDYMEKL